MENDLLFKIDLYIEKYINHLKSLNYSINTINTYSRVLNELYEFCTDYDDKMNFIDIGRDFILSFLNNKEYASISTKSLYLNIIKAFFKFIDQTSEYSLENRLKSLTFKVEQKRRESLSKEEYQKLLLFFQKAKKKKSFNTQRDILFLKLLLFTGIRASELLDIKKEDITPYDESMYQIKIRGKGNKQRFVYIDSEKIEDELEFVLSSIPGDCIAVTNRWGRVSKEGLYTLISNKLKRAGIKKRGVHILRHTFAKELVSRNINLSTIKDLMGHENILTTMVYAKSDERNMVSAVRGL